MKMSRSSVLLLALCTASLARPQSSQNSASVDESIAQHRYDPLAGRPHVHDGIWDKAIDGIGPDNKGLGESVRSWRQMIFAETVQNVVFWTASGSAASVLLALLFLEWLLHDRARRLHITVNIITQIANAYVDARDHALEAIEKHNRLADDFNALAEKMAAIEQQKIDNQRRVRGESSATTTMDRLGGESRSGNTGEFQGPHPDIDPQFLAQLRRDAEAQIGQRLAHQISALNEKNKTLRASLNESVAEIEQFKREQAAMKGV